MLKLSFYLCDIKRLKAPLVGRALVGGVLALTDIDGKGSMPVSWRELGCPEVG